MVIMNTDFENFILILVKTKECSTFVLVGSRMFHLVIADKKRVFEEIIE